MELEPAINWPNNSGYQMDATESSKGSLVITGGKCPVLLEFNKAALNKCVAIDLPLLRAIQESALGSLGFVCHQRLDLIQKGW